MAKVMFTEGEGNYAEGKVSVRWKSSIYGHIGKKSFSLPNLFHKSPWHGLHNFSIFYIQKNLSVLPRLLLIFGHS